MRLRVGESGEERWFSVELGSIWSARGRFSVGGSE
jgi:hypothetical protein